jgi:hypothetical protein
MQEGDKMKEKIENGEVEDYGEALNYIAAEKLAETDSNFNEFWEIIRNYNEINKDTILSYFEGLDPEFFDMRVDEQVVEEAKDKINIL